MSEKEDREKDIKSKMEEIMKFFEYKHLPEKLQKISEPFCTGAKFILMNYPLNEESLMAMRKILEAKDCAVRSWL